MLLAELLDAYLFHLILIGYIQSTSPYRGPDGRARLQVPSATPRCSQRPRLHVSEPPQWLEPRNMAPNTLTVTLPLHRQSIIIRRACQEKSPPVWRIFGPYQRCTFPASLLRASLASLAERRVRGSANVLENLGRGLMALLQVRRSAKRIVQPAVDHARVVRGAACATERTATDTRSAWGCVEFELQPLVFLERF